MLKTLDKTDLRSLFHNANLGWRLARKGKLRLRPDRIEHVAELGMMLEKTREENTS
jgi:hypothetical protein